MRWTALDGALMGFDRDRGVNVLYADDHTRSVVRRAPRSLQIGLLTPCNLACSFCYRDQTAPSRLDRAFLVDLLQRCAAWGVLEVAFGGGEPLLFKGFAELVEELHATTGLGLNVTTNGMLLTPALAARLRGKIGEYRLSIYPDNGWATTLAEMAGERIGVNWLVTPANVHEVVPRVRDFLARGAHNVLLLGYKGHDPSMLLDDAGLATLRAALRELDGAPVLLDICWYPQLPELPHLFPRTDCGAGDDILVITADRAVQACSFADHRIPFRTFDELRTIYGLLRTNKPRANTAGCTRELFQIRPAPHIASGRVLPAASGHWQWRGRASSNSGAYTILARFRTEDSARMAEQLLDDAYQAHLDYIGTPEAEGRAYYDPTPPLQALAKEHGFVWPADDGFAWEGDWDGSDREEADQLEIERLGKNLVVHIAYGQRIGAGGIEQLCKVLGADAFITNEAPFRLVVTPQSPEAAQNATAAIDDVDGLEIEFDSNAPVDPDEDDEDDEERPSFDGCDYRIEIAGDAPRQIGFGSTIGGVCEAARAVLALARVKGLAFELEPLARPDEDA